MMSNVLKGHQGEWSLSFLSLCHQLTLLLHLSYWPRWTFLLKNFQWLSITYQKSPHSLSWYSRPCTIYPGVYLSRPIFHHSLSLCSGCRCSFQFPQQTLYFPVPRTFACFLDFIPPLLSTTWFFKAQIRYHPILSKGRFSGSISFLPFIGHLAYPSCRWLHQFQNLLTKSSALRVIYPWQIQQSSEQNLSGLASWTHYSFTPGLPI